jgi:hypothetical protein
MAYNSQNIIFDSTDVHPTSYPMGTGTLSPGVKRPGCEDDHSLPSSVDIKNGGAKPPLPTCFHGVVLITHRDDLIFLLLSVGLLTGWAYHTTEERWGIVRTTTGRGNCVIYTYIRTQNCKNTEGPVGQGKLFW